MTLPGDHNCRRGSKYFNMTFHIIEFVKPSNVKLTLVHPTKGPDSRLCIQPGGATNSCTSNQGAWLTSVHPTKGRESLVSRPLPRFYLATMEKSVRNFRISLHGCKIKSGQRPGNEARGMTHTYLCSQPKGMHTCALMFNPFPIVAKSLKKLQSISANTDKFIWAYRCSYWPYMEKKKQKSLHKVLALC